MIQIVTDWIFQQDSKVIFVLGLAASLFCVSVFFLSLIVFSKTSRKRKNTLRERYWPYIQKNLAFIAIQSVTQEGSQADYSKSIEILRALRYKSNTIAQWILEELIKQKANVSGDAGKTMLKVYRDLDLKSHSLRKLKSMKWNIKAEGIHELERMEQKEIFSEFYRFLDSKNHDLRTAARMGLTTLAPNPLSFLDQISEELSEWEQMSIYNRLRNKTKDQLPDFSKYYSHKQQSVVAFSINMTVRFNYFELVPQLIKLLTNCTPSLRVSIVHALSQLEAFQARDSVRRLLQMSKNTDEIVECLKFLGQLDDKSCRHLIWKFMEHPRVEVRMEAVNAAIKLDLEFKFFNTEQEEMFLHFTNELIS
ncbi:MAG: hypothetical protein ABJP45_14460 [Cyclobacteriaceae bacterium]